MKKLDGLELRGKYVLLLDEVRFNPVYLPSVCLLGIKYSEVDHKKYYVCNAHVEGGDTVKRLCDAGARVAICATYPSDSDMDRLFPEHKGCGMTFRYLVERFPGESKAPYGFVPDCLSKDFLAGMRDGDAMLLENVWFNHYPEYKAKDEKFIAKLVQGYDICVYNLMGDADGGFDGVEQKLPVYAGYDMLAYNADAVRVVCALRSRPRRRYRPSGKPCSFGIVPDLDLEYPDLVNTTVRRRGAR